MRLAAAASSSGEQQRLAAAARSFVMLIIKYFIFFFNSKQDSLAKNFSFLYFSHIDAQFSPHYTMSHKVFCKPSVRALNGLQRTSLEIVFCGMVRCCFPAKQVAPWRRVFIKNRLGGQRVRLSAFMQTSISSP